jgi:hypothetical protein
MNGSYQPYVSFDQDGSKSSAKKLKQPMMEYRRNADRRQYRARAKCGRAKGSLIDQL